ncbi:hypothetical protein ABZ749_00955 [Micromonospora sp. NPDC047753]|uniref:DUF7620 family protein n=1 Tax=Micromonospora sp. NPDC047753 TaxID=3154817 RepID=UPI0033C348A3
MIWRRRRKCPSPEAVEVREGLEKAREDLAAARADDAPVDRVAQQMHDLRRKNHFGPMITDALRGAK